MPELLRPLVAAIAMIFAAPAHAVSDPLPQWTENEVSLVDGDVTLRGTLLTPGPHKPEFDAVLILSGSGPTDRDGNQPAMKNDSLKMLAHALGFRDIASLRIDKRGIAASAFEGMREVDMRFDHYVDDAASWIAFLRTQPGVKRIFVVGHSEGALIGAIAGAREKVDGYISLAGAGDKASNVLRRQLRAQGEAIAALAEPTLQKLEAGELDSAPNLALAALFRPSVQPYLISWFKYDPAEEIKKSDAPVLIVQGTTDIQVLVEDAERLKAARPDAGYALIDGMNHILKIAPADRQANIATYSQPALPLAPGLMEAIVRFVTAP